MVLHIVTAIISLLYLGWSPNETSKIDPNDWKRKWIVFFTWFNAAALGLMLILSIAWLSFFIKDIPGPMRILYGSTMSLVLLIIITFGIVNCVFTLQYLGTNFENIPEPDPTNWRRQWIIVIAWITLVLGVLQLLTPRTMVLTNLSRAKTVYVV